MRSLCQTAIAVYDVARSGAVAEWLRSGLQSRVHRFDSGRRLSRYARIVTSEELANFAHVRRARDLMDREYDRPLDVDTLARAALMSTAHFSRQFRATYGETPYAYLMTRRIERAKALLRRGDLSV